MRRTPVLARILALLLVLGFQGGVSSLVPELGAGPLDCGCGTDCGCRDQGGACCCARIGVSMTAVCSCGGHGSGRALGPQVQELISSSAPALVAPRCEAGPRPVARAVPAWLLPHELLHPA